MSLFGWSRTYKSARRLQQIINVFLKHGFGRIIDLIHLGKYIPFRTRFRTFGQWPSLKGPSTPEKLRMAFEELGPSFIKLAQILSSRPDLITAQFANEFKKLQDEVPAFPAARAKRIIEEETKTPVENIFSNFTDKPVAAASIAQVHHAKLLNGNDVIVKVQRPGIKEQIETDINILNIAARLLDRHVPESRFFNPIGIVDEFSRTVRKELDFINEARSCNRFRKNFENSLEVYIPRVYPEYSTEKVLVMERVDGVRIDNIEKIDELGFDRKKLAKIGIGAYFKMILEDGFFHADPHPGNIFVLPNGMLCFVDFGIVGRVTQETMETMASTFTALINSDFDGLIDHYIELGIVPEDIDLDIFRREFKADLIDFLEPMYGLTLSEINFAQYLDTLTHLALSHRMKVPADLLLINKAFLILENIGSELDPDFDLIAESAPFTAKLARKKYSPSKIYERASNNITEISDFLLQFPKQTKKLFRKLLKDELHFKLSHTGLDKFRTDMDRSTNRIAFSLIISSILLSSAIMHAAGVGPSIFGISVTAIISFGVAFILGIWLIISIIRSGML